MKQKTGKLTGLHWLSVVILGMCYTTFGNMQYLVQYYYVMYQEANGLTDMQMSTILTAIGIAAVIAYAYNGFLTDLIKPRLLMTFTLSLAILGGVILLFNPGYVASIIIFCGYALLPMWGPMSKLLVGISTEEQADKIFGYLDFFTAVFGLAAGFIAARIVASSGSTMAVRGLIIFNTVCNLIGLLGVWYIGGKAKAVSTAAEGSEEDAFSFKKVLILFRDPNQWLLWLGIGLGYTGYIAMTYASPLLTDVFGMSVSSVTVVDAIKNNAIGLIAPLIAGSLASKFGAVRSYFVWLALYVIAVVAVIVTPWAPALVAAVVLSVVLLSFSVKGRSAISNTVLTNAKTPMALFGTSVCIQSVFMTIPDTFCYNIAGNMLETYGNNGYYYIFGMCLVFSVAGLICNIILDRRLKAGKTSEWFFSQHLQKKQ